MKILYGGWDVSTAEDVTLRAYSAWEQNGFITIPATDMMRFAGLDCDPAPGVLKSIWVIDNQGEIIVIGHDNTYRMDLADPRFHMIFGSKIIDKPGARLARIHEKITMRHGSLMEEYPEQLMAVRFLPSDAKVLEIGANVGRNTLVIASILSDPQNLLALECDPDSFAQLLENRDANPSLTFRAENAALSRRAMERNGWNTRFVREMSTDNQWIPITTLTLDELRARHPVEFDTLVLDCEGAFLWILEEFPEILNGIHLILMENDYTVLADKMKLDSILFEHGFYRIYHEAGGWGCCYPFFFEAWRRA